ncbi:ARPP-2 domain-containing protein [Nocardiopsis tropica]|uniref:ARG and Rhodanese-Phosphatase-superfamily-associated domain-containing protein n=1 Tax=Nocardiopsis tropica TaxID=109330 RepID=A0ABV1ZQ44_9ACTN
MSERFPGLALGEGVRTGPAQQWGNVRLVPLLRSAPVPRLRLHPLVAGDLVDDPASQDDGTCCLVPHAYVLTWEGDTAPSASYGTQILPPRSPAPRRAHLDLRSRKARTAVRGRARFLPLDLAVDGLLSLHAGGPSVAWAEWSRATVHRGLSSPALTTYLGGEIEGLAEALRVFEIHPDQCGVVVHLADVLASAHLYPHPEDYRALHAGLLMDMFGESLYMYGLPAGEARPLYTPIRERGVRTLGDLRERVERSRSDTLRAHDDLMLSSLTGGLHTSGGSRDFGGAGAPDPRERPFTVRWLVPAFARGGVDHVGEVIADRHGRVAYLKSLRLSPAQSRRGRLLRVLGEAGWELDRAALSLGTTRSGLVDRLERARLSHLLSPGLLAEHRAATRRRAP